MKIADIIKIDVMVSEDLGAEVETAAQIPGKVCWRKRWKHWKSLNMRKASVFEYF